jgi:hypothetical protein
MTIKYFGQPRRARPWGAQYENYAFALSIDHRQASGSRRRRMRPAENRPGLLQMNWNIFFREREIMA